MKKLFFLICPFLAVISLKAQTTPTPSNPPYIDSTPVLQMVDTLRVYTSVELMPSFPGGLSAMKKFMNDHKNAPVAVEATQSSVTVSFIVERNGALSNIKILRGLSAESDSTALQKVRTSPKWSPARLNGKYVRFLYTTSLDFKSQ